ncbi:MAG: RagB/SusD family nutrient uptake outer membrane protein [Duncaniella sp.]|nr:RagB/SusD family nutrient uptake outer membrane protein [Muribaculaceae bacterium Isolate-110 (HZI)]
MKHKIFILAALAAAGMAVTSCDDFLDQTNTYQGNLDTFFDSDEAIENATAPLYNYVWCTFNEKFYYSVGDGRANNITARWSDYIYPYTNFTDNAASPGLEDAWGSFYSVIAQSNNTINAIIDKGQAASERARIQGIAEARFMRGLAFWYIGQVWAKGIIYTDTQEAQKNTVVPPHRQTDVIEFAIRDMEYAAANLSPTAKQPGRVTCHSAYGMLSRFYLTMAGLTTDGIYDGNNIATDHNRGSRNQYYLDLARKAAEKCIKEGPYRLMDTYGSLFAVPTWNNNSESVFQLQWLQGGTDAIGWGANNAMSIFFQWSTMVGEENWGNATYASYDLVRTYRPDDFAVRRYHTICTVGAYYPDLNVKNGGYTYNVTEKDYEKKCNIKKHVVGKYEDNGVSYKQSSGVNTYMMRLAEVYLNYVEAVLGNNASTSDATALQFLNDVRTRAKANPKTGAITYEDIKYERRIEFALEGLYWYDLLNRSYYCQQEVINYLNAQERNASYQWDETETCQYAKTADADDVATATAASLTLSISNVDLTRNPLLESTPVAYPFGEREVSHTALFQ